ncbi:hypothetical protein DFH08DRAFT_810023 [Mycena albidolilacea]|uniref:Uncharacterized protein n=1 Tax=Mycena albidolilacea TaxID=1033008 RepID=A0AAD6ZYS5_9AGAR|nr:hypothetical protein DFH08DRAFT_810023 [Mycena albidolilacea]
MDRKRGRVEIMPVSSQGRNLRLDEVESTVHGDSTKLILFILLDMCYSGDWRAQMLQQTKLHHQWLIDLENSAVRGFTVDCMGGHLRPHSVQSHPDKHLPHHACWLLHLLGKNRVPLYFFYGQGFPLKEPIPDPLVKIGFVPHVHEVGYLQSLWLHNNQKAQHETSEAKGWCLIQENYAVKGGPLGKKGAHDLCTALASNEEAEPDEMYNDNDYNNGYVQFQQPASPANIIPSIPDVPGRQKMEDETATQVLEQAYNLGCEDPYKDGDNLPGWRTQDVLSTITYCFGFEEPVAPISSSQQMELEHLVEGDLKGFQAELCDLTSPDSDLTLSGMSTSRSSVSGTKHSIRFVPVVEGANGRGVETRCRVI